MAERLYNSLVELKNNITSKLAELGDNLSTRLLEIGHFLDEIQDLIAEWFTSIVDNIVNLPQNIANLFKDLFNALFAVDMDKIKDNINLVDIWKSKFAIFYDMQERFEQLYNGVSTNASLMSDGETVQLMASGDNQYVNLADPLKIYMETPEFLTDIIGESSLCILDLNQPQLLKLFAFCRAFLTWSVWFGFFFHVTKIITPRFYIG